MHIKNILRFCKPIQKHTKSVEFVSQNTLAKPLRVKKTRSAIDRNLHFVDFRTITAIGGNGGDGCIAFLRLYKNPMAGPIGGDGGNGGHVIFQASSTVKSLASIPAVVTADDGENGIGKNMYGASGKHFCVDVPVGTVVKQDEKIITNLDANDAKFVAARGGAGGHGNRFFLSNKNRHPEIAEIGGVGEQIAYTLELKIIAHVGLVGFPNAGKSTLLRAISRAKPKVAAYPFTTLNPHIGIVHYDDYVQIAVADLPGLIPDAHKNKGLGISFLKHIERCVCLLYVIDLSFEHPLQQFECLQYELEQYQKDLSKRPCAIVANKWDLPDSQFNLENLKSSVEIPVYPVSAKRGDNVRILLDYIRSMYDKYNKDAMVW